MSAGHRFMIELNDLWYFCRKGKNRETPDKTFCIKVTSNYGHVCMCVYVYKNICINVCI